MLHITFLVYHCFDLVVIQGYLPLLTRSEHIVHFFRDVHGIYPITKQALAQSPTTRSRTKTWSGPPASVWNVAKGSGCTSSSKAWNRAPLSVPDGPPTPPRTPTIAPSKGRGRALDALLLLPPGRRARPHHRGRRLLPPLPDPLLDLTVIPSSPVSSSVGGPLPQGR